MFRRFFIAVLIFIIAVVVAADRLGVIVAAHVLASKVQSDEQLPNRPTATIAGFPFLNQAFGGFYKSVTIKAANVPVNGVGVTMLTAQLHGVHIPFRQVWRDSVAEVPVDRIDGVAFVSFASIDAYLTTHEPPGQRVTIHAGTGGNATVFDRVRVGKRTVSVHGVGALTVFENVVSVALSQLVAVPSSSSVVSRAGRQLALKGLDIALPLHALPFRMQLKTVSVSSTGVTVTGSAARVVLGASPK